MWVKLELSRIMILASDKSQKTKDGVMNRDILVYKRVFRELNPEVEGTV